MTGENGNMYMPVAPMGNYYGNNDGMFGGNWMWFLLVWMAMFGWGGNGFGFGGNRAAVGALLVLTEGGGGGHESFRNDVSCRIHLP